MGQSESSHPLTNDNDDIQDSDNECHCDYKTKYLVLQNQISKLENEVSSLDAKVKQDNEEDTGEPKRKLRKKENDDKKQIEQLRKEVNLMKKKMFKIEQNVSQEKIYAGRKLERPKAHRRPQIGSHRSYHCITERHAKKRANF